MTLTTAAAAAAGLGVLGASTRWNWWRLPKKGIPVLLYHRIGNPPAGSCQKSLWVNTKRFDWQMGYLQDYGYTSVNFHDLAQGRLPMKPVIITFDDGYLNQYTGAYPVLKRRGMTGVFYIVADAVGKENSWHDTEEEPRQMLMSLDQIKEMAAGGMEIGSHGLSHAHMATISLDKAGHEMTESKKKLEDMLGASILSFAFPYGNGEDTPELVNAAFDAGYRWVIGIHAGIWQPEKELQPSAFRLQTSHEVVPRIFVRGDDWKFDFYLQLTRGRSRL